jgi:hypothetical protein
MFDKPLTAGRILDGEVQLDFSTRFGLAVLATFLLLELRFDGRRKSGSPDELLLERFEGIAKMPESVVLACP